MYFQKRQIKKWGSLADASRKGFAQYHEVDINTINLIQKRRGKCNSTNVYKVEIESR